MPGPLLPVRDVGSPVAHVGLTYPKYREAYTAICPVPARGAIGI
jgi:hypothetical protein